MQVTATPREDKASGPETLGVWLACLAFSALAWTALIAVALWAL